ncbi:hypothetical protein IPM09_02260 [Candidatus Saccharibacteria bacterium]|nr:MAG: hypothetical protein IPM09_02260 [Candidatus Saccharibacteria bacterium]
MGHQYHSNAFKDVELIICDVDDTLVRATGKDFYKQYGLAVERAIAEYFHISIPKAEKVANQFRQHGVGAEQALFTGDISIYLPRQKPLIPNFTILHQHMTQLDPKGYFSDQHHVSDLIRALAKKHIKTVALTSSPTSLSGRILLASNYKIDDFAMLIGYESDAHPPKATRDGRIFEIITKKMKIPLNKTLVIGDKPSVDIEPAVQRGALGCLIGAHGRSQKEYFYADTVEELFADILKEKE